MRTWPYSLCLRGTGMAQRLFDDKTYKEQCSKLGISCSDGFRHYSSIGWRLGLDPTTWFSTVEYLELNPDVATAGVNPFIHFLKRGSREGRRLTHGSTKNHEQFRFGGW